MKENNQHHCQNCEMRSKSIFCELEKRALDLLSQNKSIESYKKGEVVFNQGSAPEGIFCIHSGKVKLTTLGSNGKATIINIIGGGGLIGYRSLFTESLYQASATVIEDAQICYLDKNFFFDFISKETSASRQLIKQLAHDISLKDQSISNLTQKSVRARLASFFVSSAYSFGQKEKDGIKIQLQLSREEVASIVGVATETLIRTLSDFKEEKLITQIEKTIFVPDLKKLERVSLG